MSRKWLVFVPALLVLVAADTGNQSYFDGKTWWSYVKVLAADNMEGRETGSTGLHKAEAYVVSQLQQAGVQPAGSNGYYQPVKFRTHQIVEEESSLALIHDGKEEPLTLGDDAYFGTRVDLAPELRAQLVFAGNGLSFPENNYNDLAGLDLKNKVAVIVGGAPSEIPGPLAAHHSSSAERWKAFRQAGAIGIIYIPNPAAMDIPWSRISLGRKHVTMMLADPKFDDSPGEKLSVTFNPASAEKLFAGSGHTFAEVAALAKQRKRLPHFPLAVSIKAKSRLKTNEIESDNIVAKLPGSDPQLSKQYIVLSAHIDHLGIAEAINGDPIYNGAMDNASGSAVLLDVAAELKKSGQRPKRSLLFLFVTAEEKGLLGSRYFAAYPTVASNSIVADINIDMFMPIVPLKYLTVWGLDESSLGADVRKVAATAGVQVQNDPEPQRNVFVRSDQYNFIRHGIPALMMEVAPDPNSTEQKQMYHDWLTHRYHAPSDDLEQPVNLDSAAKYEDIVRGLMVEVADSAEKPQWKQESFFRQYQENPSRY